MEEKKIVETIYNNKAKDDELAFDLTKLIKIMSQTVFGDSIRFVFELLQNADDSHNKQSKDGVHVEFKLFDNYLVFSHTGLHFTGEDVKGISSIGGGDSNKENDIEKTGYKGIGFKSVFRNSDYVQILSDKFSFRFDRNHDKWKNSEKFPWQLIPIWTEGVPNEVDNSINKQHVNTIIKINDKLKVKKEIEEIFSDCQILLFLRNVRSLTFSIDNNLKLEIEKKDLANGTRELYKNSKLLSCWLIKDFVFPVPEKVNLKIQDLTQQECPDKIKEAKVTKLTFAALISDLEISVLENSLIYCYLPTKVSKGLPFLVNGDFLTNAERTNLMTNEWNNFLFATIAQKQFEWIKELLESEFKFETPKLIKIKFTSYSKLSDLDSAFNIGLDNALNVIDFLPELKSKNTCKVNSALIDSTGIIDIYPSNIIISAFNGNYKFIEPNLKSKSTLLNIGVKEFGITHLLAFLNSKIYQTNGGLTSEGNIKLINFLFNSTKDGLNPSWIELLKNSTFLLDINSILKAPKDTYLPVSEIQKDVEGFLNLNLLNKEVFNSLENNVEIINWLSNLGVREPNPIEIIRKSVFDIIISNTIVVSNAENILKFTFKVYKNGDLKDSDYQVIKGIKLNTNNGLKNPTDCYLPDIFEPQLKVEVSSPSTNFAPNYLTEDNTELNDWKNFYLKIGVEQNIALIQIHNKIERVKFIEENDWSKTYFEWLDRDKYPSKYSGWKNSGQHSIKNFTTVNFPNFLTITSISKRFWHGFLDNWDTYFNRCADTEYHYMSGYSSVPSFIQFQVRNESIFPSKDLKCYKSTELYIPELKPLVDGHFPILDYENKLTQEQIEFFGFKIKVSIVSCFKILMSLELKDVTAEINRQIMHLYEQIIDSLGSIGNNAKTIIDHWKTEGNFLTINNSFKSTNSLYIFNIEGIEAPVNSERFIKLPKGIGQKKLELFSQIFDVPILKEIDLTFVDRESKVDLEFKTKLLEISSYLAIVLVKQNSDKTNDTFEKIYNLIKKTTFYSSVGLSLVYNSNDKEEIYNSKIESWYDGSFNFYFIGKWNSPQTRYTLVDSICRYLDLKNLEKDLSLFLELSNDEIKMWLIEKNYEIVDYDASSLILDISLHEQEEIGNIIIPEVDEIFKPEIKAKDYDFSKLQVSKKSTESKDVIVKEKTLDTTNPIFKNGLGRWCEEFVNEYLKNNIEKSIKVIWVNEIEESNKPYDFEIIENSISSFIDVKGTVADKEEIYLSKKEWMFMFEKGKQYSLYRVFYAGNIENTNIKIVENPCQQIAEGNLLDFNITLHINK